MPWVGLVRLTVAFTCHTHFLTIILDTVSGLEVNTICKSQYSRYESNNDVLHINGFLI